MQRLCLLLTNVGLAEEAPSLRRGRRRWGVLDLRRRRRARLAHAVSSVHLVDRRVCKVIKLKFGVYWGNVECEYEEAQVQGRRRRFV